MPYIPLIMRVPEFPKASYCHVKSIYGVQPFNKTTEKNYLFFCNCEQTFLKIFFIMENF